MQDDKGNSHIFKKKKNLRQDADSENVSRIENMRLNTEEFLPQVAALDRVNDDYGPEKNYAAPKEDLPYYPDQLVNSQPETLSQDSSTKLLKKVESTEVLSEQPAQTPLQTDHTTEVCDEQKERGGVGFGLNKKE